MKYIILITAIGWAHVSCTQDHSILMADPTIFSYNGTYFLYGTNGVNADSGFYVMESKDLKHWYTGNKGKRILENGSVYGTKGFWAPQVFQHNKKILMAYTANEQIAIAGAKKPDSRFTQNELQALPSEGKQIDPFIFTDDDGRIYFYHVRLQEGNRIFGAEMKPDFSGIDDETLRECIVAESGWENTKSVSWPVAEGPTVIKVKGKYLMFYSANDFRNPDYAVGYAVADHPLGPWKKSEQNPIISRTHTGHNGSGHGDILVANGQYHYVLHTHFSDGKVAPRRTGILTLSITTEENGKVSVAVVPDSFQLLERQD